MTISSSRRRSYCVGNLDCHPRLVLNVPDGTNFFDIKAEDFELLDYNPVKPQLKFDLAI